ncbi:MAG: hypothetical protein QN131_00350 [Armatimonadota bacterium]|nr:hypothetical protein [Armatimonadota bacterium]MDR7548375.1 hypothetical protein [Armatimonadota bacterium]
MVWAAADFDAHYAGMDTAALGYTRGSDADGRPAVFLQNKRFRYTARGSLAAEMDPLGNLVSYTYDPAELVRVTRTDALGETRIDYDPGTARPTRITPPDGNAVEIATTGWAACGRSRWAATRWMTRPAPTNTTTRPSPASNVRATASVPGRGCGPLRTSTGPKR